MAGSVYAVFKAVTTSLFCAIVSLACNAAKGDDVGTTEGIRFDAVLSGDGHGGSSVANGAKGVCKVEALAESFALPFPPLPLPLFWPFIPLRLF